jgi:hypothetical protein
VIARASHKKMELGEANVSSSQAKKFFV